MRFYSSLPGLCHKACHNGPSSGITLFYSVARDAEVISVYSQEWDGELSDLDVETKELGLFDPLNLPAMLKTRGAQLKSIWHGKEAGSSNFTNAAASQRHAADAGER